MPHQRLRKFNTKDVSINNDLCMVMNARRHIFIRSRSGFDLEGSFPSVGGAGGQGDQTMRDFKVLLEDAGSKLAAIGIDAVIPEGV